MGLLTWIEREILRLRLIIGGRYILTTFDLVQEFVEWAFLYKNHTYRARNSRIEHGRLSLAFRRGGPTDNPGGVEIETVAHVDKEFLRQWQANPWEVPLLFERKWQAAELAAAFLAATAPTQSSNEEAGADSPEADSPFTNIRLHPGNTSGPHAGEWALSQDFFTRLPDDARRAVRIVEEDYRARGLVYVDDDEMDAEVDALLGIGEGSTSDVAPKRTPRSAGRKVDLE